MQAHRTEGCINRGRVARGSSEQLGATRRNSPVAMIFSENIHKLMSLRLEYYLIIHSLFYCQNTLNREPLWQQNSYSLGKIHVYGCFIEPLESINICIGLISFGTQYLDGTIGKYS